MSKNRPLKILVCCPFPLDIPGGVTTFTNQFVHTLKQLGHNVYTVGPFVKGNKNPVDFELGRPYKINIENSGSSFTLTANFKKVGASSFMANALIQASFTLKKRPIFTCTYHSVSSKWTLKTWMVVDILKTVRTIKFWQFFPVGFEKSVFYTLSDTIACRIAVSSGTAKAWNKIDPKEYFVVPNGIDINRFESSGKIIKEWKRDGKKIILFTGRHDKRKGLDDLVNAFAIAKKDYQNVRLIIAGEGHETKKIKKLVFSKKIPDVDFYNFFSETELAKVYRTCDIFVSTSKYNESFGRTLAEALSCGTPVIATKIEGILEWLDNKPFARLADPENPQDLSEKLLELLKLSDKERKELGIQGRKYVKENFYIEKIAKQTLELWNKCLKNY